MNGHFHDSWHMRSASALQAGLAKTDFDLPDLWIAYVGIGGAMTPSRLEAALHHRRELSRHDHDLVAQALNDYFTIRGHNHPVPYADDITRDDAGGGEPI